MRQTETRISRLNLEPVGPDERVVFLNATLDARGARIEMKTDRGIVALTLTKSSQLETLESIARVFRLRLAEHEEAAKTQPEGVPS